MENPEIKPTRKASQRVKNRFANHGPIHLVSGSPASMMGGKVHRLSKGKPDKRGNPYLCWMPENEIEESPAGNAKQ